MSANYETNAAATEDDDFLYGDIDEKFDKIDHDQLLLKLVKLEKENANLKEELQDSKAQIVLLSGEKETLETNMTALYNTAVNDIKRKDKQIIDLKMSMRR